MKNAVRRKEFFIYEIIYLLQQTTKIEENTTSITYTLNNLTKLIVQTTLISPIFFSFGCVKKITFVQFMILVFPSGKLWLLLVTVGYRKKCFPANIMRAHQPISLSQEIPLQLKSIASLPLSLSLSLYVCMCLKAFMRFINVWITVSVGCHTWSTGINDLLIKLSQGRKYTKNAIFFIF